MGLCDLLLQAPQMLRVGLWTWQCKSDYFRPRQSAWRWFSVTGVLGGSGVEEGAVVRNRVLWRMLSYSVFSTIHFSRLVSFASFYFWCPRLFKVPFISPSVSTFHFPLNLLVKIYLYVKLFSNYLSLKVHNSFKGSDTKIRTDTLKSSIWFPQSGFLPSYILKEKHIPDFPTLHAVRLVFSFIC